MHKVVYLLVVILLVSLAILVYSVLTSPERLSAAADAKFKQQRQDAIKRMQDHNVNSVSFIPTIEERKKMREILALFSEICIKNKIEFWAMCGTELGISRNNDILVWDDDIDVGVTQKTWDELSSGKYDQVFRKSGLRVIYLGDDKEYIKISFASEANQMYQLPDKFPYSWPFVDVFRMVPHETNRKQLCLTGRFSKQCANKADIFPLKRSKLGRTDFYSMKSPKKYLDNTFGKKWMKEAKVKCYSHREEKRDKGCDGSIFPLG